MAKEVRLVDDLDGSDAAETIRFSFKSEAYEIDLSEKNAAAMTRALEKYIAAARPPEYQPYEHPEAIRRRGRSAGSTNRSSASPRDFDPKEVRQWAAMQGIEVSPRGRVPAELVEKFKAATAAAE
jgi:hypothetical protein